MKRKRGILAVVVLLMFLAAGVWIYSLPANPIVVTGTASTQEVNAIERAVKKAMRAEVFPSASWDNLKAVPRRLSWYFKQDVRRITVLSSSHASVIVATSSESNRFLAERFYRVDKGTNGWKAHYAPIIYDFF